MDETISQYIYWMYQTDQIQENFNAETYKYWLNKFEPIEDEI